jgi:hydrogenase/urease accessory protein HupE
MDAKMKLASQRCGFWCCTLLLIGAVTAHAHDPGLSTATITVGDHRIDLVLGFAEKDVESLLASCGDPVEIRNPEGFAAIRSELESLAARETNLRLGDRIAVPQQTATKLRDSQNIEILLRFERTNGSRLSLVSKFIARLPFGHREFVSVQTAGGGIVGEGMLSSDANTFQIDLRAFAAFTARSDPIHPFFVFLMLGVEHILTGYDHLLFLFGLLIVCRDMRSILTVITCFTIAHSITLALAALGVIQLPARIVEPLIAASIAYVGLENLLRGESAKRRWLITFCFGLVHGLGFAGALKESGIGSGQFGIILPLVGFNLGVEIGQLSVAAVVLPILWQLRKRPGLMRQWAPLGSVAVTLAGSYWLLERVLQN